MRNVRLLSLDHVSLLAGTTYRGQYEERIRGLVAETTAAADVILFIDELHNLIGQGTAIGTAMDAANMLKPALVRGDFRVLGATTSAEYERWVEGDPALERRFQKVIVRELGDLETMEILIARKERLERHHNVLISEEALRAAVKLTDIYVKDRMRPDKAIDAIDEACAHLQATIEYSPAAESLIKQRVEVLKEQARSEREREKEEKKKQEKEQRAEARESPSALERFGAELEALFVGAPEPVAVTQEPEAEPAAARPPRAVTLAPLEAELSQQLMQEGAVIRGHDIARVVGLMAGRDVVWEDVETT
jgi:ATP-dependent Clp protease ATP-binding subunit ClpA